MVWALAVAGATASISLSCSQPTIAQDANQVLYLTIDRLTRQANPQIQRWLAAHPQDPQTQRFRELQSLGRARLS